MKAKKSRRSKARHLKYTPLLVIVVLLIAYVVIILTRPLKLITPLSFTNPILTTGKLTVSWPSAQESSIGVLGDGTLASNGTQTPTPTASIAKMVTSLAVLKKYPLTLGQQGPTLTMTVADVASYNNYLAEDGSVIKVAAGEQITEYQALEAMLLPSADNMADTLATWAFGSVPSYISYANPMVKAMGMNSTTIGDASGYSPSTVSTSSDLITLGEASLNNPVIAQIVDLASANLPVAGNVINVDHFVGQQDLIGIKTGNTDQAGGCFLSAAKYTMTNGQSIIVIGSVMKATTLQDALNATLPMLASVKKQLQEETLAANTAVSRYVEPWGGYVNALTRSNLTAPYLPGMTINYTNKSDNLTPPSLSGTNVGTASFGVGNSVDSTSLSLSGNISKPSAVWRLLHPRYFI